MKMVTKIAVTASTLLFVLAQFLSGYLIYQNYTEKIAVVQEKESELMQLSVERITKGLNTNIMINKANETVFRSMLATEFRNSMLIESALYCENDQICNSTKFQFENMQLENVGMENYGSIYVQAMVISDRQYLLFYSYEAMHGDNYVVYHMLDVTDIYKRSVFLAVKELIITFGMAVGMAFFLYVLIRRITKPLKDTNELQQQFIGGMAHEMRTPLTAMKGYAQTILQVDISREQEEKALNYINSECDRLSRLTEKMTELTRLYQTECESERQKVDLVELMEQARGAVNASLEKKGIVLLTEGSPDKFKRQGDRDLLIEFLINLVNNAAMASGEGDRIWIGADADSIWVRDEGSGIPKEELENVKKAFYRVDKSRSRKSGNMGLGLSICDRIAELHHGKMKIRSQIGEGTKISLSWH